MDAPAVNKLPAVATRVEMARRSEILWGIVTQFDDGSPGAEIPGRPVANSSLELEMLFCCARTTPDAARIKALAEMGVEWRALLELAGIHGVRPLVYRSLRSTCWNNLPAELQEQWQSTAEALTGKNLFLTGELLRVARAFEEAGTPVAAIKGPAIAEMVYGDFTLREFGDLDLLVAEADAPRALEMIERLGYERFWKKESPWLLRFLRHVGEHALISHNLGVEIDLHWRVSTKATALAPDVSDLPSGFQPVPLAGARVLSFAPCDLPLYLAAQGGWDEWRDLRRICDVAEFLRRFPEVDWTPHLETAQRIGGLRSMLTGLALAEKLLGAELPRSAVEQMRRDVGVSRLVDRTVRKLRSNASAEDSMSRYFFQLRAKTGIWGKTALAGSILTDRTTKDGSWVMLPRHLWFLYPLLRPLRMCVKLLRSVTRG